MSTFTRLDGYCKKGRRYSYVSTKYYINYRQITLSSAEFEIILELQIYRSEQDRLVGEKLEHETEKGKTRQQPSRAQTQKLRTSATCFNNYDTLPYSP